MKQDDNARKVKISDLKHNIDISRIPEPTEADYIEILELVNEYRAENGIEPLELNNTLNALALIRAKEASIKWSHERPNGTRYYSVFTDYNITWASYVGENLGCKFTNASEIMEAWIASDSHRANLLDDKFNDVGMAIYAAEDDTLYIAQIFASAY